MGGSDEEKYDHPTQKPVDLMRRPILNHLRRGELVYDPFLGSGTTLAAAELTERVCYGIELDPKYVDVMVAALAAVDGQASNARRRWADVQRGEGRTDGSQSMRFRFSKTRKAAGRKPSGAKSAESAIRL